MEISGLAPPATVIRSAMSPGGFWPTSQRRSSSGSATVADRPIACSAGHIAAQPRKAERQQMAALGGDQRMQLVEHDIAQVLEEALRVGEAISSASCSGVVSRMSGGLSFWRWRLCAGVSPVRVSIVIGSPISPTGLLRLRSMSTASAFSGEM